MPAKTTLTATATIRADSDRGRRWPESGGLEAEGASATASPRRARCASMMALSAVDDVRVRAAAGRRRGVAGVQSEAPADRSNAEPDIEKLLAVVTDVALLEVRTGTAVGTKAGPGAADTCGWSVIGGWNGIAWRRGAEYCGGGRPCAAAAWAWAWACSAARPLTGPNRQARGVVARPAAERADHHRRAAARERARSCASRT